MNAVIAGNTMAKKPVKNRQDGKIEKSEDASEVAKLAEKALRSSKNKERADPGFTKKAIRMTNEYAEWLEGYAKFKRMNVATCLDTSLANGAKADGFRPPPERIP